MSMGKLELLQELKKVNHKSGFLPRKLEVDGERLLLLDPTNPYDKEWYENNGDYE